MINASLNIDDTTMTLAVGAAGVYFLGWGGLLAVGHFQPLTVLLPLLVSSVGLLIGRFVTRLPLPVFKYSAQARIFALVVGMVVAAVGSLTHRLLEAVVWSMLAANAGMAYDFGRSLWARNRTLRPSGFFFVGSVICVLTVIAAMIGVIGTPSATLLTGLTSIITAITCLTFSRSQT